MVKKKEWSEDELNQVRDDRSVRREEFRATMGREARPTSGSGTGIQTEAYSFPQVALPVDVLERDMRGLARSL